jgi:FeS assembly SUF system regulator
MIRITKQADYAFLILTHLARCQAQAIVTARDLAEEFHLGLPMVSKVLKLLARGEVLESHRGIHGGYSLRRPPAEISVVDVIKAVDGPIAITECAGSEPSDCKTQPFCHVAGPWQRINRAIVGAMEEVSLAEMAGARPAVAANGTSGGDQVIEV